MMKKRINLSIATAIILLFAATSCDIVDKADDISFSSSVDKSVNVDNAGTGTYTNKVVLDVTSDAEVAKYKEKIKGIVINKMTYQIKDYSGPATTTFSGDILFGIDGDEDKFGSIEIAGLNLQNAATTGEEKNLGFSQAEVDAIATQLKENGIVNATLVGTISEGPVSFSFKIKIDYTVEADAL